MTAVEPEGLAELDARARTLLDQMRELLDACRTGAVPAGPAYRHRVEGAVTALEALLELPPSLP